MSESLPSFQAVPVSQIPALQRLQNRGWHATILHLIGLNHEKLTYRHSGRDYRLTDVHVEVVGGVLG